jgi:hypothetical protein
VISSPALDKTRRTPQWKRESLLLRFRIFGRLSQPDTGGRKLRTQQGARQSHMVGFVRLYKRAGRSAPSAVDSSPGVARSAIWEHYAMVGLDGRDTEHCFDTIGIDARAEDGIRSIYWAQLNGLSSNVRHPRPVRPHGV